MKKRSFSYDNKNKVRNYCHYTEKYQSAARSIFNLRYKILK